MSHTLGGRGNWRGRSIESVKIPSRVTTSDNEVIIEQSGVLDSDIMEGEIHGNGTDVLIGLSNLKDFHNTSVFGSGQKGIAIGYLQGSTHFCAFSSNGTAATSIVQFPVPKDTATHLFHIKIFSSSDRIECTLDTIHKVTLTTNIPLLGEVPNVISYGIY